MNIPPSNKKIGVSTADELKTENKTESSASEITLNDVKNSDVKFMKVVNKIEKKRNVRLLQEPLTLENKMLISRKLSGYTSAEAEFAGKRIPSYQSSDKIKTNLFEINSSNDGDIVEKNSRIQKKVKGNYSSLYLRDSIEVKTTINEGLFHNLYSPSVWVMNSNDKNDSTVFFSNVVMKQYEIASKEGGFYGQLPSVIIQRNILNQFGTVFTKKYGVKNVPLKTESESKTQLEEFLSTREIGTSTRRLLSEIGMRAIDIEITPYSVYLILEPNK